MKRDFGIILIVLLAVVLGGLAGALTGRSGGDDAINAADERAEALDAVSRLLDEIEGRVAALESASARFENESGIDARFRHINERLSRLERKTPAPRKTGNIGKPGFQPKPTKPPDPAVARRAEAVKSTGPEARREMVEKQYGYRKKYVERQVKMVADVVKKKEVPLTESQLSSLKEIMYDTLSRKKEFDLLVIDDSERARERTEEFRRLEEHEDEAIRGLLDETQFKAYEQYIKRRRPPGWRRRGRDR